MSDVVLYEVSTDVQRYPSAVVFREAGAGAVVDQYDCLGEFVRACAGCQGEGEFVGGRGGLC